MALSVQMYKVHNYLTDEDIVITRLVNQQTLDFNALCEYLADGSTVTAADVAAVMKQIEIRLPLIHHALTGRQNTKPITGSGGRSTAPLS